MHNLIAGDLKIDVVESGPRDPIVLVWSGKSNHREPNKILGPYLGGAITEAVERKVAIELHFEKVDHFNSSTVTSIIQLIQEARQKSVRLVFIYDQKLKWQKLSFDALRVFDKGDDLLQLRSS
jgi:hypothetical protein